MDCRMSRCGCRLGVKYIKHGSLWEQQNLTSISGQNSLQQILTPSSPNPRLPTGEETDNETLVYLVLTFISDHKWTAEIHNALVGYAYDRTAPCHKSKT